MTELGTEGVKAIEREIEIALHGYDFVDVNLFPFESDKVVVTFGRTSDRKYFFVVVLEEISGGVSRRQRALLEFPIGHEVKDLKRAYEGVRKGDYLSRKLLSETYIFAVLLSETKREVGLDEVGEFLRELSPSLDKAVEAHRAGIGKLVDVLDVIGDALHRRGLEGLKKVLQDLEEIKSIEDLKSEKLDRVLKEVEGTH